MTKRIITIIIALAFGALVFVANWNAIDACHTAGGDWLWLGRSGTCYIR